MTTQGPPQKSRNLRSDTTASRHGDYMLTNFRQITVAAGFALQPVPRSHSESWCMVQTPVDHINVALAELFSSLTKGDEEGNCSKNVGSFTVILLQPVRNIIPLLLPVLSTSSSWPSRGRILSPWLVLVLQHVTTVGRRVRCICYLPGVCATGCKPANNSNKDLRTNFRPHHLSRPN